MNKSLPVVFILLAIGYTSCKQVAYKPNPALTANSYFPQTLGSTWKYRDSSYIEKTDSLTYYGPTMDTVTYTMNGTTTDFNGEICYNADVISKLSGAGTSYFSASKHVFSLLELTPPLGQTNLQFLIDTASVGNIWINTPTLNRLLNGLPVQAINAVLEKNITRVVNGITFNNVYHTSVVFQTNIKDSGFKNIAYFGFYIAKGVGIIEKDAYFVGVKTSIETIMSYDIK